MCHAESIPKSVMLALVAISYKGIQNILSNSWMEWQLEQTYSTASQSAAFKKDKIYLDAQFWMLVKKKKSVPLSSIYLSMQLSIALFLHQKGELQVFKQLRRLCMPLLVQSIQLAWLPRV